MEQAVLEQQAWVNALLGRMFWDFLGEKYWSDLVSKKIQMKLSKIKVGVCLWSIVPGGIRTLQKTHQVIFPLAER